MKSLEPFGTTPFPVLTPEINTVFDVKFFSSDLVSESITASPQQPQTQQIAVYDATPIEESIHGASVIAVNQHFICYAVKNGLIRVLHRHSTLRTLLRAHAGQNVTDLQFFQDGDVLATAGSRGKKGDEATKIDSKIVIWRVFERSPDIVCEKLLEIETDKFIISRVLWHPFNPNQYWMIHLDQTGTNVASLVETTRIATVSHPSEHHPLCSFYRDFCVVDGGLQIGTPSSKSNLADICWSTRDTRYVLSVHESGHIVLWDISCQNSSLVTQDPASLEGIVFPSIVGELVDNSGILSRCIFLPHENSLLFGNNSSALTRTSCFITAAENNSTFTLWSAWPSDESLPSKIQKISVMGANKPGYQLSNTYLLDVCFGPAAPDASPPSCFIGTLLFLSFADTTGLQMSLGALTFALVLFPFLVCYLENMYCNKIVCADRAVGRLFAFHCRATWSDQVENVTSQKKALLAGCDYVVPFTTKFPTYSFSVLCAPTQDISEEDLSEQGGLIFDMKLFSYQSSVVQCLTLTSYMCLPPSSTWTDTTAGVIVERLDIQNGKQDASRISPVFDTDEVMYDEDYDVDDDEGGTHEDFEVSPEASALPLPDGIPTLKHTTYQTSREPAKDPFSNWLGAIATGSDGLQVSASGFLLNGNSEPVVENDDGAPEAFISSSPDNVNANDFVAPSQSARILPTSFFETSKNGNENTQSDNYPKISSGIRKDPNDTSCVEASITRMPVPLIEKKDASDSDVEYRIGVELANNVTSEEVNVDTKSRSQNPVFVLSEGEKSIQNLLSDIMVQSIVPTLQQAVNDSFQRVEKQHEALSREILSSSVAQLKNSIDNWSTQNSSPGIAKSDGLIAEDLIEPVNMVFSDSLKKVIIPFLESITGQVLSKVSDHLEKIQYWNEEKERNRGIEIESISKQLSTMTQLVAKLTDEVQTLRSDLASARALPETVGKNAVTAVSQPPKHHVDSVQARRNEILLLLRETQFELAFTKAVSASAVDLVVYCCRNADLNLVLGGNTPALSQPILLCMMQQLGTLLPSSPDSDLQLEVEWLQEITMCLNPVDSSIQRHGPVVFQQVVGNIKHKLKLIHGTERNQLRRQLQRMLQLIRGISVEAVSS